ncbi:MAG: hypothetical protein ABEJ65_05855, partial [bacterium]
HQRRSRHLMKVLISGGILFLLYLPWGLNVVRQATRIASGYWLPDFVISDLFFMFLWYGGYLSSKVAGPMMYAKSLVVVGCFLFPLLYSITFCKNRSGIQLCAVAGFVPLLAMALYSWVMVNVWDGQSVFIYRIFLSGLPFFLILAVDGLKRLPVELSAILVVCFGLMLVHEVYLFKANPANQYVEAIANKVENQATSNSLIVHTEMNTFLPSRFYHADRYHEWLLGSQPIEKGKLTWNHVRDSIGRRPVILVYSDEYYRGHTKRMESLPGTTRKHQWPGHTFYFTTIKSEGSRSLKAKQGK